MPPNTCKTPLLHAIPDRHSYHGRFTVDFPMRIPLPVTKCFSSHKGYSKYLLKLLYSRCLPCEDLKEVRGEGAPAEGERAPGHADGGAASTPPPGERRAGGEEGRNQPEGRIPKDTRARLIN